MDKKHCAGCEDNFYNGNNNLNVKECWRLKEAKVIHRKRVHLNQMPPWKQKAERYPSCYHVKQYVFVKPDATY